ncbi:MAG: hypothetical protein AAGC70_12510 [Pseudomonadota bacterium]
MGVLQSIAFDEICLRGCIRDSDVARLRALFYADGEISAVEATGLFEINDACRVQDRSWAEFFVEAVSDYVVQDAEPAGYITTANADWVIDAVTRTGRLRTRTELELLITILEKARWSPTRLVTFVLEQVKDAVIHGVGPLRDGSQVQPGRITLSDVRLARRAIYAFGGDGNIGITQAEAECLFEINDAVSHAAACPEWIDFFAKAIANSLMVTSGYAVPSREEALRQANWLANRGEPEPTELIRSVVSRGLSGVLSGYRSQSREETAIARLERQRIEIITNEAISECEAGWLIERLQRNAETDSAERALLAVLHETCDELHASVLPLLRQAGIAA